MLDVRNTIEEKVSHKRNSVCYCKAVERLMRVVGVKSGLYVNKRVLLRERKRHTACRVESTPSVVLTGYPPHPDLAGGRGDPTLVPPWQGTPSAGYPPAGYPPAGYPTPWQGTPRQSTHPPAGYPP